MRVMRGIAGNLSYNVRKIQSVKNEIRLKHTPPFPASPAKFYERGSFRNLSTTGNASPDLFHIGGAPAYSTESVTT